MLLNGRPCATKCEKNSKAHFERIPESEHGFEHLTEHEDMVVSQDGQAILCFASHCSLVLIDHHRLHGVVTTFWLCLRFCFCVSLLALSSSLSS